MLSAHDKDCILEIIELIPSDDVLSLGVTITNNCVEIKTKDDAVKALLLHESSLRTFLMRKKITKSILFNYLHSKEVYFQSNADKSKLVDLVISHCDKQILQDVGEHSALAPSETIVLGHQFTEWFYSRLNADFSQSEGLVEEDFWSDCQSTVHVPLPGNEPHNSSVSSGKDSLTLLQNIKLQHNLLFSPNISEDGIKIAVEPHGLVIIMVCGTLHSTSGNCVGLFEHMFGLIRNPLSANNYKIKKMSLVLRNNTSHEERMIKN